MDVNVVPAAAGVPGRRSGSGPGGRLRSTGGVEGGGRGHQTPSGCLADVHVNFMGVYTIPGSTK